MPVETFLRHLGSTSTRDLKKQFRQLATFVKNARYPTGPELVFWEADAKLVKTGTKNPITAW
jgi:hypothetical protein